MDEAGTPTLPEVLKQIFEMLGIDPTEREKMTAEVMGLLALTAMNNLLEPKSEEEKKSIQAELEAATESKSETEKVKMMVEYFGNHWDKQSIEKASNAAAQDFLPSYIKAILEHTAPEQKEKVNALLKNLQVD